MSSYQDSSVELGEGLGGSSFAAPTQRAAVAASDKRVRMWMGLAGLVALVALLALVSSLSARQAHVSEHAAAAPAATSSTVAAALLTDLGVTKEKSAADPTIDLRVCEQPDYTRVTLKTAEESTMVALFRDLHGQKKFEASDVIRVNDNYVVVYDNLWELGLIHMDLEFRSDKHQLITSSVPRKGDSGFEALVYDEQGHTFYVMIEAVGMTRAKLHSTSVVDQTGDELRTLEAQEAKDGEFHAIIETVDMPWLLNNEAPPKENGYLLRDRCMSEFAFPAQNKGFEGAVGVRDQSDLSDFVLIALCEGNYCEGGARGKEKGHGRLVLMRKKAATDQEPCMWQTINVLALPETAHFADYSSIALMRAKGTGAKGEDEENVYNLAVTSQESSQVWLGQLRTGKKHDLSDWEITPGRVLNFPRSGGGCEVLYCNIEGVTFLDENMLVAVSDKMKSKGKQHYRCLDKDQSIHTFVLP